MAELRIGAREARYLADQFDVAIVVLGGKPKSVTARQMLQQMRIAFADRMAQGKSVDQVFDEFEHLAGPRLVVGSDDHVG